MYILFRAFTAVVSLVSLALLVAGCSAHRQSPPPGPSAVGPILTPQQSAQRQRALAQMRGMHGAARPATGR